jgi:hypothetical protein
MPLKFEAYRESTFKDGGVGAVNEDEGRVSCEIYESVYVRNKPQTVIKIMIMVRNPIERAVRNRKRWRRELICTCSASSRLLNKLYEIVQKPNLKCTHAKKVASSPT